MRRFFIESSKLNQPTVVVTGSEARHIKNVLRLKPGDSIMLFDGTDFEYEASIIDMSAGRIQLAINKKCPALPESPVQIIVAQAFLKERKMDDLVRQLCELGAAKWIPFVSERSVSRPPDNRLAVRTARWKKIAKEALKQCGRSYVPEISDTLSFEQMLDQSKDCDLKIVFWENESRPIDLVISGIPRGSLKKILVMLGPEGGFSKREIELAKPCGFEVAGLGPRILRAETATLAVCTLMQYIFGDMGLGAHQTDF